MKIPFLILANALLAVLLIHLVSCITLTPADYARIGEIVTDAIHSAKPSGK